MELRNEIAWLRERVDRQGVGLALIGIGVVLPLLAYLLFRFLLFVFGV